ncbi:MAG: Isoleucine--tRNA ligase [Parcubacteria group bacterium ADurb.Bin159]|nr:MAG: Isoleucine--tRNA ligase [Parcubacteria group bacterium ADurb.Bin159]
MENYPKKEEQILEFWQKEKIFEKCQKMREDAPIFSFYDGPPFASGSPHYGHILASVLKDTVLRYFTMCGYNVPRSIGWDCHGLPVENLVEKKLQIKTKKDILNLGKDEYGSIEKFNSLCRENVFECIDEWKKTFLRLGRWVSYEDQYTTLNNSYIESVWWVFKELYKKGLIYKDYKVAPYCARCGTPLSNFEVNLGYKDIDDNSLYLKFALEKEPNCYFLAWTTTPWTLPANTALAIRPDVYYQKLYFKDESYIFVETKRNILENTLIEGKKPIKKERILGKKLVGIKYKPLYPQKIKQGYFTVAGDFVETEEGTGIVHIAPAFGEDDMNVGKKYNLDILITVDENGQVKGENLPGEGLWIKDADKKIIEDLKKKNLILKEEKITHTYPFCWRCDWPLLYYPIEAFYVKVSKIKKELVFNNLSIPLKDRNNRQHKGIHWVPAHLKRGRFGKWLSGARDWAISRNRFWGAPLPIWECQKCGNMKVIGSRKELIQDINDLHRPYIDKIFFECEKCGGIMKRREEIFDCWFESGSMPYASFHYPFENKKECEKRFPADFIVEGLDQTRGWFYTLHVLSTILFHKPAYKNVFVNGLILDSQGKKLSKKLRNYPEPDKIFNSYGADSLRYWLLSEVPAGESMNFSEELVQVSYRNIVSTLQNVANFVELYLGKTLWQENFSHLHILDKWILSSLYSLEKDVQKCFRTYDLRLATRKVGQFIQDLSLIYVRFSRERIRNDKNAQEVLIFVLINFSKILAPFTPFLSEDIYQRTIKICQNKNFPQSVHLCSWPKIKSSYYSPRVLEEIKLVTDIIALGRAGREEANLPIRQPLAKIIINKKLSSSAKEIIAKELNLKEVREGEEKKDKNFIFKESKNIKIALDININSELKEEGQVRQLIRLINDLRKKEGLTIKDEVILEISTEDEEMKKIIKKYEKMICHKVIATQITLVDSLGGQSPKINLRKPA